MRTSPVLLSVDHLTKVFNIGPRKLTVLQDISFSVEAGSECAVIGPSGSGKTTLLAICAGLERPTLGTVLLDDVPVHGATEEELATLRRRVVGFIFQNFHLFPSLTAVENVMLPAEICGDEHARARAKEWLERVGLKDRFDHYPAQLSGGEQQRVAIARAFVNRPKILFADEPTGNLDGETARGVIDLIFELQADFGTTLVLVSHDQALTRRANRVMTIEGGRLVGNAPPLRAPGDRP
ncbi:MAG TPA: ABC transporter ATP-binding protein [Candidatus Binatia bacterium]|nr:ABC transporter ATP-binding protein [Candidatus Binatia bacterium]